MDNERNDFEQWNDSFRCWECVAFFWFGAMGTVHALAMFAAFWRSL